MSEPNLFESHKLGEKYYEIDHRSGLKIFVIPKKFSTLYAVFGTRFGSADDKYRIGDRTVSLPAGTAHFLEHKLFENPDGTTSDESFSALGAETNAYTTYTATRYLFSATKRYGECLSELLRFVTHPYFTPQNVKKEQGIIAQEIMMYADDPYETVMENCLKALYRHNSVRKSICGDVGSISKITDSLLYETYGDFYNLHNMVLSVCGDITPEAVLEIADRELPESTPPFTAERIVAAEGNGVYHDYTEKRMRVARPLFFIGVKDRSPENGREKLRRSLATTVLNNMLFAGTGEFYNRLHSKGLITPGFSFGYSSSAGCAMNYFSGNSDKPEEVYRLIREKSQSAAEGMLDREDFERCRRSSLAAYFKFFDSSAEIADDVMLSAYTAGVNPFEVPDIIESLTYEDTLSLAAGLFRQDNWALSLVLPL